MLTKLHRIMLILIAALASANSIAQDSTGQAPMYPNAGTPPASGPVIDEGAVLLCIGLSQAHYTT